MNYKLILKILAGIFGTLLLLMVGVLAFVYYELNDEQLSRNTRDYLSDVLGTEVELKEAKLHPLENIIAIYGFNVKDLDNVDMLHVDTLEAQLDFWQLFRKKVVVYGVTLAGANAVMYKERKDTAANYQFVIDALRFSGEKEQEKTEEKEKKKGKEIYVDLRKFSVSRTSATWDVRSEVPLNTPYHKQIDPNHLWIHNLTLTMSLHGGGAPGSFVGELEKLSVDEQHSSTAVTLEDIDFDGIKKTLQLNSGDFIYQDKHLRLSNLTLEEQQDKYHLGIKDIDFENGIGVAKKNRGPKKGAFDAHHLNMHMTLDATATCLSADSIAMKINKLSGKEQNSGLVLDNVTMSLTKNRKQSVLHDVSVKSGRNTVKIALVNFINHYDSKASWVFTTSTVSCHAMLQDIAHAFAPALQNFSTPILCTTTLTGNRDELQFHNIKAYTSDHRLTIAAQGNMRFHVPTGRKGDLKDKPALTFNITNMQARDGIKEQILAHFKIKPKALDFFRNLGDITFKGTVDIPYRRQIIRGLLTTCYGNFDANVTLNSDTHYLNGTLATQNFNLGDFIANKNIGNVALTADVTMDMKRKKDDQHSKIPAGTIKGRAIEASYMGITIRDVDFNIVSDAKIAKGNLATTGKLMDLSCDFSFDEMDIKHSLKVKPHVKMHNIFKSLFKKKERKE